jgi:hypothetical protein
MPIGVSSAELTYAPPPTGNGIRVVTNKGTFEVTEGTIPQNVFNKPIPTIEAWANQWLADNLIAPPYVVIHIFSLSPFNVQLYTGDVPPDANWWVV